MKRILFLLSVLAMGSTLHAQTATSASSISMAAKLPEIDKSPLDMCYYPANYPVLKIQQKTNEAPVARVIYSRPLANNRTVFGELVEWNKVWRLGANEATEIEFYRDVKMGGRKVPKGKYTLYAIPNAEQWTIIVNKDTDTWGAFKYDEKKDVARVPVAVKKNATPVNAFSMLFEKSGADTILLNMAWENAMVSLPIDLK